MRTSRKYLDLNYIKILPSTQTQTQTQTSTAMAAVETIEPKPVELNAYQNNYKEVVIIMKKIKEKY